MMMTDNDYLWDGSGAPDPEVQRLERALGRLRSAPPPLRLPEPAGRWRTRSVVTWLATAAVIVLMVGLAWRARSPRAASWEVNRLAGRPLVGSTAVRGTGRLAVGETLTTDASSRARVNVSTIGQVIVEGNSRLRLLAAGSGHYRLALDRGTLEAVILAAPGQFVVDTPSATATDLGCVYTLHVNEDGSGLLSVTTGWVAFELNGRESFVPAGASSRTDRRAGPGTPRFDDADPEFQMALERFDFRANGADRVDRARTLRLIFDRARTRDAMTLWHLLSRVEASERGDVFDALAALVPPPAGTTRDRVLALDAKALDQWWDALHLGEASFWRMWKRPLASK
jgi:hypothetical protein